MLPLKYLSGIEYDSFENMSGIFVISHYIKGFRYVSSYSDGKKNKSYIFKLLPGENSWEWEIHHVVEGQHFADIDFAGRLEDMYLNELPCVFIHKQEHVAYNQLLHISETSDLFRDKLPKDKLERSVQVSKEAVSKKNIVLLKNRLSALRDLYFYTYQVDSQLQKIAMNVFHEARSVLNKIH